MSLYYSVLESVEYVCFVYQRDVDYGNRNKIIEIVFRKVKLQTSGRNKETKKKRKKREETTNCKLL